MRTDVHLPVPLPRVARRRDREGPMSLRRTVEAWFAAALRAHCDALQPADPYLGVVTGPDLVARTEHNRAQHEARYRKDDGFPVLEWGPFGENRLGCRLEDK